MAVTDYESYSDWYKKGPLSSYVKISGMAGDAISVIEASQPAGDMSDPPVNELVLMRTTSVGIPFEFDFGAGRFSGIENFGDFHLVAPNTVSDIQVHAHHSCQLFSLPAESCHSLLDGTHANGLDFGVLHSQLFRSDLLNSLCERLVSIIHNTYQPSRLFVDGAAMLLLGELSALSGNKISPTPKVNGEDWRIRRTMEQIDARLGEDVGLPELAASVNLSPSHLNCLFQATTGMSPHAWLLKRKIERACDLLRDPRLSVTEIAHVLGFSSSQHFATAFKQHKTVTPSAWRRNNPQSLDAFTAGKKVGKGI
ncbi:MAG: AraC family transcriptional regulator [Burkholderiaceae bacterium]|nr:AraC family transcriptional regulator [Burkholderiaceae bacterium]